LNSSETRSPWPTSTLTRLSADLQTLATIKRSLVYLVPTDALASYAETIFMGLQQQEQTQELEKLFKSTSDDYGKRILVEWAHELCEMPELQALLKQFDGERAALWLAMLGVSGVFLIERTFGFEQTMLVGALGGFLAPVVNAIWSRGAQRGA
jgi:hypothetical protein